MAPQLHAFDLNTHDNLIVVVCINFVPFDFGSGVNKKKKKNSDGTVETNKESAEESAQEEVLVGIETPCNPVNSSKILYIKAM